MANKTIKMELSHKSIQDTIKQLRQYQNSLKSKNELFVRRLSELGIPVIDQNISLSQGDSDKNHSTYIKINSFGDYSQATLVCEGAGLLFIEFGAGIHYNTPAEWVRSYGTEATMPVYKASMEIIQNIRKIAKEIFST